MSALIAVIGAVFAFFMIVLIHEFGHFIVARACGIKVHRFAIGFGKPIFKYRAKSGVEYVIGFLPLGGYIKMQDAFSGDSEEAGSPGDAYESKSVFARMAVVLAGPLANLILSFVLFSAILTIGVTELKPVIGGVVPHSIAAKAKLSPGDQITQMGHTTITDWQGVVMFLIEHIGDTQNIPVIVLDKQTHLLKTSRINLAEWRFDPLKSNLLDSIGVTPDFPKIPPVVFSVLPDSPAAKTTLQPGDRILAINKQPIVDWQGLVKWVEAHPNHTVSITVKRNQNLVSLKATIGDKNKMGYLGIQPAPIKIPDTLKLKTQYPWYSAPLPALYKTGEWIRFHVIVLKQMLMGRISPKTMGGPVSIFQTAGSASLQGLTAYLEFMALISIVLGVLNLLPIPGLDGGHFAFCLVESLTGKPLPVRIQIALINLGILFLISLMIYATMNDLMRLFGIN